MRATIVCSLMLALAGRGFGGDSVKSNEPEIPRKLELNDQYDKAQVMTFPATNVIFLTIADRKGSDQIGAWITALKARPATVVDIRGLADLGGVPGFLRGRIRKQFRETIQYPVMMDWSGKVCAKFNYVPDLANIYIIDRNGNLAGHFHGRAVETNLNAAFVALDKAAATPVVNSTNRQPVTAGMP